MIVTNFWMSSMENTASCWMILRKYSIISINKGVDWKTHIYLTLTKNRSGTKYMKMCLYATASWMLYGSTGTQVTELCIMVMAWGSSAWHVTFLYSPQRIFRDQVSLMRFQVLNLSCLKRTLEYHYYQLHPADATKSHWMARAYAMLYLHGFIFE